MNYVEQLLAKIEDVEAREQLSGLVGRHAVINDYIVDPEVRQRTDEITQWADTEWDYEHGMSKLEFQQGQQLTELRAQVANRKDGMELNELNEYLGKYIKDNGLVTKAEYEAGIAQKAEAFERELNTIATLSTRVAYLNGRYQKEFGDMFDPDEFIKGANDKGYAKFGKEGLDRFYNEDFTAEKRAAKQAAELDAMKAAAREEGRREALKERLSDGSGMPTLDGAPEMGHYERKLLKMQQHDVDPKETSVPQEVELGRGVGRIAAAQWDARDRAKGLIQ